MAGETTALAGVKLAGRYAYVGTLGEGSSGRVVRVRDAVDGAHYAVKLVGPAHADRLRWELSVLSGVAHPGLARVHELVSVESALPAPFLLPKGTLALVEEFAEGRSAGAAAVGLHPTARARFAVGVGLAVSRALSALHAAGLAHGDVKPANIVVPEDPTRARLVDLGLARAFGVSARVSGTPAFIAPEAWLGEVGVASDLYALGATLHALVLARTGRDTASTPGIRPPAPNVAALPESVPVTLRRLLGDLLAEHPAGRPSHARAAAHRFAALAEGVGLTVPTFEVVSDEASPSERAARMGVLPRVGNATALEGLRARLVEGGVVVVAGPPGSGRTRLIREAVRGLQRAGVSAPTYLQHDGPAPPPLDYPAVVHLESPRPDLHRCRAAVDAAAIAGRRLTVVVECRSHPDAAVQLGPVSDEALVSLLRAALEIDPSAAWVDAARRASGGLAGRLCRLLAEMARQHTAPRPGALIEVAGALTGDAGVSTQARPVAERLTLAGGALPRHALGESEETAAAVRALMTDGLAREDDRGWIALRPDVVGALAETSLSALGWATDALDALPNGPAAALLVHAVHGASGPLADAIESLFAAGDPERAAALGRQGIARGASSKRVRGATANALRALARETEGLKLLDGTAPDALRAELLRLTGDGAGATRAASAETDMGRAILARVALGEGRLEDAAGWCEGDVEDAEASVRLDEVRAFVALARGDLEDAQRAAMRAVSVPAPAGAAARARATRAAVLHAEGRVEEAAEESRHAFDLAHRAGERLAAATYRVNVGVSHLELGRPGPAIEALRDGASQLVRLARTRPAARALYNLANAACLVGDDDLAAEAARRTRQSASEDPEAAALAELVQAELTLRAGKVDAAGATLREALSRTLPAPIRATLVSRLAIVFAIQGQPDEARAVLREIEELTLPGPADVERRVAHARLALEDEDLDRAEREAGLARERARDAGFESRLRAALVAADVAERRGDPDRSALATARALLDTAAATMPPSARIKLRAVPAYARALATTPRAVDPVPGRSMARALARYAKQLVRESRLDRLEAAIVDAGVDLADAERGFLVVRDPESGLRVKSARAFGVALTDAERPSMSVVERVLHGGAPVVSVDALQDERLGAAESIHALALRSILAVPLPTRPPMALVLDDRLRPAAFDDTIVQTVRDLAEIAAGAMERAEALSRERRERKRLAQAEERLAARFEAAERALANRPGTSPFDRIVGDSNALRRTLDRVSRVAVSDVPVLVRGESGAGKELIARAVHDASPRRDGPFIGENVSAIPATLLESALFGHVRGAFTGADRDRRGLFELAEGGTLFLDEIGEMPAAMQAKLLRVLQDGELRAVGGEDVRRVDVRLVTATHRDLEQMIASGAFRQDLYYRIAVVTVPVPPLRERRDDVPLLLAAMVERHATRSVRFTPRALEMLRDYDWPGNVRELENEVRRALLLTDGEIDVAHLSVAPTEEGAPGLDPLDLKGQVAALERRLIRRALTETDGNQTQAAKRLGVSRYGLSKMLKRLGLTG
ncbi:MAG: sigma 54-interacting transcriptional regulator [Sandaracinaceae bacterium]